MDIQLDDVFLRPDRLLVVVTELFDDGYYAIETVANPLWGGPLEEVGREYFVGLERVWSWSETTAPSGVRLH
jgi:hypothetical protein